MTEQKIIYEPHPITPERKSELRAKGYKIIDAKFAPKEEKNEDPEAFDRKAAFALLKEKGVSVAKNTPSEKLSELIAEFEEE